MTTTPQELEDAVSSINQDIYGILGDGDNSSIFLKSGSDGFCQWVEFLGCPVWESENEERTYDEGKDAHEPIEEFLRRKMKEHIQTLQKLLAMAGLNDGAAL
jgi:hypothetical protein